MRFLRHLSLHWDEVSTGDRSDQIGFLEVRRGEGWLNIVVDFRVYLLTVNHKTDLNSLRGDTFTALLTSEIGAYGLAG